MTVEVVTAGKSTIYENATRMVYEREPGSTAGTVEISAAGVEASYNIDEILKLNCLDWVNEAASDREAK